GLLAELLEAPIVVHAAVQEVLIDGGQLVGQAAVEFRDDLFCPLHAQSPRFEAGLSRPLVRAPHSSSPEFQARNARIAVRTHDTDTRPTHPAGACPALHEPASASDHCNYRQTSNRSLPVAGGIPPGSNAVATCLQVGPQGTRARFF